MDNVSINYTARDFNAIKGELLKFSKKYYPQISQSFNDSSVGAWFIDLMSAVGDDLSYSIDRAYQENNVNFSQLRSSALNIARLNGVKIPGEKASMVEVELSCEVGVDSNKPMWKDCPIVKRGTQVGNGSYSFEITEDVNFAEQFNDDGYSNRKYEPNRNANGAITSYTITKSVMAVAGTTKVYKKVISESELQPFMEVLLPELNVMNVESVIFKTTTGITTSPKVYEYFIDAEQYQIKGESVKTYHYFEVDSLSELYRFGEDTASLPQCLSGRPIAYTDYTESWSDTGSDNEVSTRTTRIYKGQWMPITQKYITEYTDNGYLKLIFGSGSRAQKIPADASDYAKFRMSNVINNDMLGVLPDAGWTMFVLYRVGGGINSNVAQGAINQITFLDIEFPSDNSNAATVTKSLKVNNLTNSIAGKDAPSTEEIKYMTKYFVGSQNRCVTINDYAARLAMMHPRYGCPYRYNVAEENNKIIIPMLGLNPKGQLDTALPSLLVDNVKEYLSGYKNITDYIELKSGKIYNLGIEADVFIDKNYTAEYVIKSIIDKITDYMHTDNHMMGDSIFIGDLEKEINKIDGVIGIIDFRLYNIYGGVYGSNAKFPLYNEVSASCGQEIKESFLKSSLSSIAVCDRIDLEAVDHRLSNDYNSMFEIKNPQTDISIKVKLV